MIGYTFLELDSDVIYVTDSGSEKMVRMKDLEEHCGLVLPNFCKGLVDFPLDYFENSWLVDSGEIEKSFAAFKFGNLALEKDYKIISTKDNVTEIVFTKKTAKKLFIEHDLETDLTSLLSKKNFIQK